MSVKIDFNKIVVPKLTDSQKIDYDRAFLIIQTYSAVEFESLVLEWLKYCKGALSTDSYIAKVGGTGDKGVDIYYIDDGGASYYQCKQYSRQLTLPEVEQIVVKILWYSFLKEIPQPENIYIIAANSVNIKASNLLGKTDELKGDILLNLENIFLDIFPKIDDMTITQRFISYIESTNFDIVKKIDIDEIIKSYYLSDFGKLRFNATPKRIKRIELPKVSYVDEEFHKQLMKVTPPKHQSAIINIANGNYYSALCLKETDFYLFGSNCEFDNLKDEIFQTIVSLSYNTFTNDFQRFNTIINESARANTSFCLLDRELNLVENSDRKGVCHVLVNEKKISWSKNE